MTVFRGEADGADERVTEVDGALQLEDGHVVREAGLAVETEVAVLQQRGNHFV